MAVSIEELNRELHQELNGRELAYKITEAGLWTTSGLLEVYEILQQLNLQPQDRLLDLGAGDGRVVLAASLFCQAFGVEIDRELLQIGRACAQRLGLSRACLWRGDCRQTDLSGYDYLYLYPDKPLAWLENLLPRRWPGTLVVYGPYFKPEKMKPKGHRYASRAMVSLWGRQ